MKGAPDNWFDDRLTELARSNEKFLTYVYALLNFKHSDWLLNFFNLS